MLEQLNSASSLVRASAAMEAGLVCAEACEARLRELLHDHSPFVFAHGAKLVIAEVRFSALDALEAMYFMLGRAPDFGTVTLRKAMPVEEALALAARVDPEERRLVADAVEAALRDKVVPPAEHAEALRAYTLLQALGLVDYRQEIVDARTYSTPLQEEVRRSQLTSERPRPRLRIADRGDPARTFGFVYRDPQKLWAVDFAEGVQAIAARERASAVLSSAREGKLARVRVDPEGQTLREADGTPSFDGEVELVGDDQLGVLRALRAQLERDYATEIVT